jgi:hypothetical protein
MSKGPPRVPTCIRCSHPHLETVGMIGVHAGGMPTYICFDCIDDLKTVADAHRRDWGMDSSVPLTVKAS